ncbi:MAG: ATP-binding protein, partial [Anaerovibrio sp.]|uniref:ATP-binding protein n=1 Tax=Anaerovibrio sp. TaxID=1872532 RepID=UPI0025EF5367
MIKRDLYLKKIRPFMNQDLVKVITGIRRCGKSVMLEIIQQELQEKGVPATSMLTYNFESLTLSHLCTAEALHHDVMEKAKAIKDKVYIFLDEVQEVKHWEKAINSFRVDLDCDIYITGSNSKLLSGELATYLAGRYVEFVMYPLSFQEFYNAMRDLQPNLTTAECFQQYMHWGGMPYLGNLQYQAEPVKQYLRDLYNAVELKDIIRRKKIRDVDLLERILAYVTANIGNTFSATTISKYLKNEGRKVA